MGAPYIYDISHLRVNNVSTFTKAPSHQYWFQSWEQATLSWRGVLQWCHIDLC